MGKFIPNSSIPGWFLWATVNFFSGILMVEPGTIRLCQVRCPVLRQCDIFLCLSGDLLSWLHTHTKYQNPLIWTLWRWSANLPCLVILTICKHIFTSVMNRMTLVSKTCWQHVYITNLTSTCWQTSSIPSL